MKNKRLYELIKGQTLPEISYSVSAKATYCTNLVYVYIPNSPYEKKIEGYEAQKKESKPKTGKASEEDIERSLHRSARKVRDYALCNKFELFVTFTFDPQRFKSEEHRFDLSICKSKQSNWLKNEQKRKGKFDYLIVAETTKAGAWHFHALIKDYKGRIRKVIKNKKEKFNLPSFQAGYTDVKYLKYDELSQEKIANYITKYMTKDMPRIFGNHRYWISSGLNKPIEIDNPPDWYKTIKPIFEYSNEWGKKLTFLKNHLPEEYRNG